MIFPYFLPPHPLIYQDCHNQHGNYNGLCKTFSYPVLIRILIIKTVTMVITVGLLPRHLHCSVFITLLFPCCWPVNIYIFLLFSLSFIVIHIFSWLLDWSNLDLIFFHCSVFITLLFRFCCCCHPLPITSILFWRKYILLYYSRFLLTAHLIKFIFDISFIWLLLNCCNFTFYFSFYSSLLVFPTTAVVS